MERVVVEVARVLLWLVYIWVTITLVLLLLTFILELFGANPDAGFVEWVYRSVDTAMAPFRGIFKPIHITSDSTLDTSVLFAMIVYGFVAIGLHVAIDWITRMARADDIRAAQATVAPPTAIGAAHVIQLTGPSCASASARLKPNRGGTSVDLSAIDLDPTRSYSVWLQNNNGVRVLAGTFEPGNTGTADISFVSNAALATTVGFGLTVLPSATDPNQTDVLASRL